ncbi:MAG: hypothetical protein AB4426_02825 [Xenococcaceae cyanobacterium]
MGNLLAIAIATDHQKRSLLDYCVKNYKLSVNPETVKALMFIESDRTPSI